MKLHTRKAFTLIELMIVIAIIAIIAAIAIPNLLSARKNGNESSAIGAIKAIANSQTLFREGDKNTDGTLQYASVLTDMTDCGSTAAEDLIDEVLASGTKSGYNFALEAPGDIQYIWSCYADPAVPGTTGDRYFGGNMAGLIHFHTATMSGAYGTDGSTTTGNVLGK